MQTEIIKQAFKLGNSAGVLLPIEWKNQRVSIKLIAKSISHEIFEILDNESLLGNTMGIFLAGSYAREEDDELSDIDILIVTDKVDKKIKRGKYDLFLISKEKLDKLIDKNLYLISLINEAKAILNNNLLENYQKMIIKNPIKINLELIKSAMKINEKILEINEEDGEKVYDGTVYSLVLRLRELYLLDCLSSSRKPSKKEFSTLIRKIASEESYNAYLRIKNDIKAKKVIPIEEARALFNEIRRRINNLENGKKK
ncbi:MAG: nucleotidyltransferase domain-containing protein [Nanoarchaeota archaeon]|nr:nucleotidyltransferase domain-containing protein [Nanoarchaeota archaeon]